MKQIAILEFGRGHTEVLFSQTLFLHNSDYTVHLLVDESHRARVETFPTVDKFLFLSPGASRFARFRQIRNYLAENKIEKLIVNTAAWSAIRYLPFMLLNVEVIGITHSVDKLTGSFYQKLLTLKIKKYFVLSDHLLKQTETIKSAAFSSFYPIFFPDFAPAAVEKEEDAFWICIPGQVEYKRRDYESLTNNIDTRLDKRVKFILLGRHNHKSGDGERLMAVLKEKGIEDYFVFFDDFIDDAAFHAWLKASDLFMPLPHEDGRYVQNAISGTFNLSYAYKKPQLMPQGFQSIEEFSASMLFYQADHLVELLNSFVHEKSSIIAKTDQLEHDTKLTLAYQTKRYIDFIESNKE